MCDSNDYATPSFPEEDIKSDVSGKMVLSVALDGGGRVKEIHVVKSLSPHLDETAVEAVRTWKFKLIKGNPGDPPNDFRVEISTEQAAHLSFEQTSTPRKHCNGGSRTPRAGSRGDR
jgi:TonB family protein